MFIVPARTDFTRWGIDLTDANDGYSVLVALTTREEAEVAVAALRAEGVGAFLGNDHHAGVMPFQMQAMGGMQVMVPSAQLDAAKAMLEARRREAWDDEDDDGQPSPQRRDRWKARLLALFFVGPVVVLLGVFVVAGLSRWGGLFKDLFSR